MITSLNQWSRPKTSTRGFNEGLSVANIRQASPLYRRQQRKLFRAAWISVLIAAAHTVDAGDAGPSESFATGRRFNATLASRISASWREVPLRRIVDRLQHDQRIAILLDRRINPDQNCSIDMTSRTVRSALDDLSREVGAQAAVVGNVVYIGPEPATRVIRTIAALRNDEIFDSEDEVARKRQYDLAAPFDFEWPDLKTPQGLLRQLTDQYALAVPTPDMIPHDLWRGALLPDVDAVEALSLVLIQFDLTFSWIAGGHGIRIVPLPELVAIDRKYRVRRGTAAAQADQWRQRIPGIRVTAVDAGEIMVSGLLEAHESITASKTGRRRAAEPSPRVIPLSRRVFQLRTKNFPAAALFAKLAKSDIVIDFDDERLAAAGIDLATRKLELEVENASADEFFGQICDQLGLDFEIDGVTVTLTVPESPGH